jgi:hypothetical protein
MTNTGTCDRLTDGSNADTKRQKTTARIKHLLEQKLRILTRTFDLFVAYTDERRGVTGSVAAREYRSAGLEMQAWESACLAS